MNVRIKMYVGNTILEKSIMVSGELSHEVWIIKELKRIFRRNFKHRKKSVP